MFLVWGRKKKLILAFKACLVHSNAIYILTWQMHWNRHFWHCALLEAAIQSFHLLPIHPFVPEDQNTTVAFSSSGAKMFFIHKTFQPLTPWLDFICGYTALLKRPFSDSLKKTTCYQSSQRKDSGGGLLMRKNGCAFLLCFYSVVEFNDLLCRALIGIRSSFSGKDAVFESNTKKSFNNRK